MQLLRLVFIFTIYFFSGGINAVVDKPCFIGIDCQDSDANYSLGLFSSIIKTNNTKQPVEVSSNTKEIPPLKEISKKISKKINLKQAVILEQPLDTIKTPQDRESQHAQKNIKPPSVQKKTHNLKYEGVALSDLIALNMNNQSLAMVLKKVLPNWTINIDEALDDIQIDVIVQTSRRQAVIDIARALSARAKFYKYTLPQPTLTLLKI